MILLSSLLVHAYPLEPAYADTNRLQEADERFKAGHFGEARRLYEILLKEELDQLLYERLQRTYLALGLAKQARALALRYRSAGFEDSWPGSWHCDMGMIAIQAGDIDELVTHVDALSEIDLSLRPRDSRTVECLAFHEVFVRRFDAAQGHLEWLAATEFPDDPPPNLAFLYLRQGRVEYANHILSRAERNAAEAAAANPDDPEPHFELGEFAAMRGDAARAVASLADAMNRGLGQTWWIYQLFDPESIPDPVFEPLYGHPDFEQMRASVVKNRTQMQEAQSD